ncbi:MAG: 30S ribosomal protein S27e [Candidatus Bathyarchaeia archaeon]
MSEWEDLIPRPSSRFLKVKCGKCEGEQIVYSHSTHLVKCRTCGEDLAIPTGGKATIKGSIISVLG